ncbi:MAG: YidC/Oxa1 family insertase periplasmic-domain containing protein [Candidatus Sumerlaeaceae bacterium]
MERRWLLFFLLSFLIIQGFMLWDDARHPERRQRVQRIRLDQTTATLAVDRLSTAARQAIIAATEESTSSQVGPLVLTRTVENTSLTVAMHPGEITTVTTEKYALGLDHVGAVVNSWRLLDPGSQSFTRRLDEREGLELVRRIPQKSLYEPVLQNWPLELSFQERSAFSYEDFNNVAWKIELPPDASGKRNVVINCLSPTIRGVRVKKTLIIPQNQYYGTLRITLVNETSSPITVTDENGWGLLLRWGPGLVERHFGEPDPNVGYDSAVYRKDGVVYSAHPAPKKDPIIADGRIEWAGVEAKFFAAIIVPEQPDDAAKKRIYYVRALVPARHDPEIKGFVPPLTLELATSKFDIPPSGEVTLNYGLYVGPKKYEILKQYGHSLQSLMFHSSWSFMRALYLLLTDVLNWIYKLVGNYGVAIIILTILVRIVLFPLAQHSLNINAKTMAEQAKIKPYIDAINEKYKNNPQEKNRQIWKLYQEHGISPFAPLRGCFPLLLQFPIFVALYRVCNDTIDLQGAHFLWIRDLSQPDRLFPLGFAMPFFSWTHFNLLPVLMALTQLLATKISMARIKVQDPSQKQMMYMMPIIMVLMLYNLPSGLMLYWNVSNVWQIFQTIYTNAVMAREEQQRGSLHPAAISPPQPSKKKSKK